MIMTAKEAGELFEKLPKAERDFSRHRLPAVRLSEGAGEEPLYQATTVLRHEPVREIRCAKSSSI